MIAFETTGLAGDQRDGQEPREAGARANGPISIYEVHPGSWRRVPEENFRPLTAAELAPKLAEYAARLNFTHVALVSRPDLPAGFAPAELRRLVDHLHKHNLGVILDDPAWAGDSDTRRELKADGWQNGNVTLLSDGDCDLELRWDTGWTRDMLQYLGRDPLFRKFQHGKLSARGRYAFTGTFLLPLSHEEVTHGRRSLLARMPGDEWQKFANLRLLLANQWAQPGKKLLFMGGEFGQWNEWNPGASLDWHLAQKGGRHQGLQRMVGDLNHLYRRKGALHESEGDGSGFEWGDCSEAELSVINWLRRSAAGELVLLAFNFTPVPRHNHRVGVPRGGLWVEAFNSDAREYGGSGQGNLGGVGASPFGWKGHRHSLTVTLPPLGAVFFEATNRS